MAVPTEEAVTAITATNFINHAENRGIGGREKRFTE
jgi:hypothetical protein